MRRATQAVAWSLGLVGAAALLRAVGTGDLATPPLTSPDGLVEWVDGRDPATAAVALVRLVAELAVWYLLVASALHVAACVLHLSGAGRLADAITAPAATRLVRAGLGLGVVAASTLVRTDPAPPHGTATMVPVPAAGTAVTAPTGGSATMRPVPLPAPQVHAPVDGAARTAPPTAWTVDPGDSLWSIAEEVVSQALGRPAADAEVDPFWRALVERNRPRLVDPRDPDLLHPGQVLEVPPLG